MVGPGGRKDKEGKTVPRGLRHLPFKDKNGQVDVPHLRNALARLSQTKLSPALKQKARKRLVEAAKNAGVDTTLNQQKSYLLDWQTFAAYQASAAGSARHFYSV